MKVKELIEKLKALPDDAEVCYQIEDDLVFPITSLRNVNSLCDTIDKDTVETLKEYGECYIVE